MISAREFLASPMQGSLPIELTTLFWIMVIVAVAFVLERFLSRQIKRFGKRAELSLSVTNSIVLTIRILLLVGVSAIIINFAGVPLQWVVAISAILGGAIGFASNKTIGNFIAGFFILTARPLRVGDYVKVGTVEGIVIEIAINYTKILTLNANKVVISNLQLLDRDVTNYRCYDERLGRSLYCYNFEIGFNHSVSEARTAQIFDEVFSEYNDLPRKPMFALDRTTENGRFYRVFLYVNDPRQIFEMRSKIFQQVLGKWDAARLSG